MVGIVAVLVLVTLSLIVTRLGASALEATGVSHGLAHFQARSAFTGDVEVRDYVQLLDVSGDYAVRDIQVDEGAWLAGADLRG